MVLSRWRWGGGTGGVTIFCFLYPVLRLPILVCFSADSHPLLRFSHYDLNDGIFTPYCNRECFGLVQNKKLCCKSNHSTLASMIIEAAFLWHKFTPRDKIFNLLQNLQNQLWTTVIWSKLPGRSFMDGFFPIILKILRQIKVVFDDIWPDLCCHSYTEFWELARDMRHWHEWHGQQICACVMLCHSCPMM